MKADAQNEIDRIDVYAINFTKTSKYGLTEKEIRQPENLQLKIDEISRNLEVMLSPIRRAFVNVFLHQNQIWNLLISEWYVL